MVPTADEVGGRKEGQVQILTAKAKYHTPTRNKSSEVRCLRVSWASRHRSQFGWN